MLLIPDKKLLFCVTCGLKSGAILPKKQVKLSNGATVNVGALEAYIHSRTGMEEFSYDKLWFKNLNSKGISLAWGDEEGYLAIGCDNGTVVILKIDPKSPTKYKEYMEEKIHKGKIVGMHIN